MPRSENSGTSTSVDCESVSDVRLRTILVGRRAGTRRLVGGIFSFTLVQ